MRACASASSAVMAISTPMRRIFSDCCATAVSGQIAVEPAITFMKSRRLIASPEAQDKALYQLKVGHCKGGRVGSDVRFGSKADICTAPAHVRFTPNSDRESRHPQPVMSALPPKADMCGALVDVC